MKNFFSFKSAFLILALTMLATVGCKKQEDGANIISIGLSTADTTVSVGSTVTLTPKFDDPTGVSYEWVINGTVDTKYRNAPLQITPSAAGEQTILLAVTKNGVLASTGATIKALYTGPFYIINEGSFGKTMGSLTRVNTSATPVEMTFNAFASVNTGKTLGTTTCYATRIENAYYFISKQGNRVVSTDLNLTQKANSATITKNATIDGRAIAGINNTKAVITSSKGAYQITLDLSDLGNEITPLAGTEKKQCGDILYSKPYLYVATVDNKTLIYNADNGMALTKTIDNVGAGFVKTPDGRIWGGLNNTLTSIDPKTLATQTYTMPTTVNIYPSWGAWKPMAGMCAHPTKNIIFFPNYASAWGGGNQIYKFNAEIPNALPEIIYTGSKDDHFYGTGLGIDPITGNVVANFCTISWGNDKNSVVVINTETNKEIQRTTYEGFYFPEMLFFYNNDKK